MENKNGILIVVVIILLVLGGVWYFWDSAPDNETPVPTPSVSNMREYFQSQMTTKGVAKVGQPIEGFDASLLSMAFPGLEPGDFQEVETVEGYYQVSSSTITFIRDPGKPITSAEKMISPEGYETLLNNISNRLNLPARSQAEVNVIIEAIDQE